jgi:hypothetical protein
MGLGFKPYLALAIGLKAMRERIEMAIVGVKWAQLGAISLLACAAPLAAKTAQRPAETIAYTLKSGESLYSIAARHFTQKSNYAAVQRLNHVRFPQRMAPGTVVQIPLQFLKSKQLTGQIIAFRGDVEIANGGLRTAPRVGLPINEGMGLQTGAAGFVTLVLSNGSRITIPSNSKLRVSRMREIVLTGSTDFEFSLDRGRAETKATPAKDANSRFRLRTPIAVSAVRGTVFRIGYEPGDTPSLTEVVEGNVAVGSTASGAVSVAVGIPAGFGATASRSGKIGKEALLIAPEILSPGKTQKEALVRLALEPVDTARGYHTQLAKDAGFTDIVSEIRVSAPRAEFSGISDGTYFVRSMAIAPSGLEGLSESYSIKRQISTVGGSAGAAGPDRFEFKWFGEGAGKRLYRFQLFEGSSKGIALVDEAGLESSEISLTGLPPGTYFWRVGVRQFSGEGLSQNWTEPEKFTVSAPEA